MVENTDQALREVFRGAGIVYAGLVIEMGIAFLAQVLAARYLSLGGFGGLTTGTAIVNLGAIVASLGLGSGLTRYLPRLDEKERARITWKTFTVTIPFALVLGVSISLNAETVAAAILNDPTVTPSIQIFGAAIPFATLLTLSIGGIRGCKLSSYRVYVENLLRPITRFALVIIAVVYGLGQVGFAFAYAIPYIFGGLVATWLFLRAIPELRSASINGDGNFRDMFSYSLPFTVTGTTAFIYRSADIFIVLSLIGSDAVGIYGVAYAAARLMLMFSTAFNFIGEPIASELEAEGTTHEMFRVNHSVLRWLLILSIPALVPFLFFPTEFITTIYRPRYGPGAEALTVLTIGFAIHNVFSAQGSLLRAIGTSRTLAANHVIGAVVNIGMNFTLIPRYGIFGAAISTTVSYLLMDLLMVFELRYYAGRYPLSRRLVAPVVIALPLYGVTALVAPAVPPSLLWVILASTVFAILYAALILVITGFTQEDLMLIRSAEEKYGIKLGPLNGLVRWFS